MPLGPFPTFSTSFSAAQRVEECLRAHYLAVYQSWGGWDRKLTEKDPRRLAYILKNAVGLPQAVGKIVHGVVEENLLAAREGIPLPSEAHLREQAAGKLRAVIDATRLGEWRTDPKRNTPILELWYEDEEAERKIGEAFATLARALDGLFLNGHFLAARAAAARGDVLYVESLQELTIAVPSLDRPEQPGRVTVYVIADLVYRLDERRVVIVDWKSGKPDHSAKKQVGIYAAWLAEKEGIAPENIATVAVFLRFLRERIAEATPDTVTTALAELRAGAERAAELVVDRDVVRNEPLPIEAFPMVAPDSRLCRWCSFRRICGRG